MIPCKKTFNVSSVKMNNSKLYKAFKRVTDISCSLIGLILSIPILLTFSILVKAESTGPAFFIQERVGLNGKKFNIYKLRSMVNDAEKNGAQWATKNDARVTRVGKFIRKTRIDEIPQLINVLKGDMSLIGPRPERDVFTEQFEQEIPGFKQRLYIKPGVTGWAQVNGGYDITPKEKYELDMEYIEKQSIKLDIKIIFYTIKIVFTGSGAR
ncbi:sugar transferase [Caryophanon latum]|uniref:UDP-phosphate N-acetylgalactosaminyl-1-phosphate transferase n=1 Tax=Caryophanon latum TaxID=33977 RepID=A0A1C0YM84_9BACL|nr:sugar transferase [Caryophanon latum]OCS88264.1 UDP-phosphate N-acetylgalactosaminyl-1-phosphate transferase [Caryophanon latum]